jgi:hypothetical protein
MARHGREQILKGVNSAMVYARPCQGLHPFKDIFVSSVIDPFHGSGKILRAGKGTSFRLGRYSVEESRVGSREGGVRSQESRVRSER